MVNYYYLDADNNRIGPVSKEELEELGLSDSTYIWYEGLSSWVQLSTLNKSKKSSKFFTDLTFFCIILLIYAVLGSLLMLVLGRFIMAFMSYTTCNSLCEMPFYLLFLITILFVILFVWKRKYWIHVLLLLFPLWIGAFASGIYYRWMCEDARRYDGEFCVIKKPFQKYGLINQWGIECVSCVYDHIALDDYINHRYCHIYQKNKGGICDLEGNILVPCEWAYCIRDEKRLLWKVSPDGNVWGLLNDDATLLLPCEYDAIYNWSDNRLIEVKKGDWFGLLEPDGTWILSCNYIRTKFNDDGLAELNEGGWVDSENYIRGGRWGVIDKKGEVILPTVYDSVILNSKDIEAYSEGGLIYSYDHAGNMLDFY